MPNYHYETATPLPDFDSRALCAEVDPELFFVDKGGNAAPAKAICAQCPARPECLDWAVENYEPYGVWGGLTANERKSLRSSARRIVA